MFYLLLGGYCVGAVGLMWEICHTETAKRFAWKTHGSPDVTILRLKQLAAEYNVKSIVDGIYENGGDVWVCYTPKG